MTNQILLDPIGNEGDKEIEGAVAHTSHDQEDGGYGWFVVLGAFMVQITSFGVVSSWYVCDKRKVKKINF